MSRTVAFRALAQAEFDAAIQWYEDSRVGLGVRFAGAVQRVLDEITIKPDRFPLIDGDVREGPVPGFPYCVYYRVRSQRVVIVAVYHQSRDPTGWQGRP